MYHVLGALRPLFRLGLHEIDTTDELVPRGCCPSFSLRRTVSTMNPGCRGDSKASLAILGIVNVRCVGQRIVFSGFHTKSRLFF